MHKWILTWILPTLLYRSCFHLVCLVGTIALACNDMSPEQTATNVNCSSPERHTRSYDYMEGGDIRVRRLFCRTQWYLRIDKRGKVKGTQEMKNSYNIMEIRTVAVGIVAIKGVESEYYLAMNKEGKLYAKNATRIATSKNLFWKTITTHMHQLNGHTVAGKCLLP
ncbi:fibroblast growth factor 7 isoform X2 [Phodopus roborovskii]|uniref:fibroblast growth factor 7 isoform X2 n=1 Tax=Phodopus roborovskii TaxID=109678 RepID=UPI0021E3D71B|nr:fibroblast growth factor 7 isoform X2 [Phodopus roborovskii]